MKHIIIFFFFLLFLLNAPVKAQGVISVTANVTDSLLVDVEKEEKVVDLKEVVVKRKRQKYSKKNNPAVDLMERVRADRKKADPREMPRYNYESYSKTLIGENDFKTEFQNSSGLKKKFSFMEQYVDTAPWTGKRILDLALLETSAIKMMGKNPHMNKEIITGFKSNGVTDMFETDNIASALADVLREIDLYDNDINLMQNRFVSPLSAIAADYYKFEIADTVPLGGESCIELTFAPKTPESFGFNGRLFIPVNDSVKYVKRVAMRVPKAINLNYIDNIFVSQNFEKDSVGKVHKVLDDVTMELKLFKVTPSLFASRQTRYKNFSYSDLEEYSNYVSSLGSYFEEDGFSSRDDLFWDEKRIIPLSYAEERLAHITTQLRDVGLFFWAEKILKIAFQGYVGTSKENSKFNIGPVNTFLSFNDVEGLRLKAGGMSTSSLSDHFFFRGYGAYGFKDKKWKYQAEVEYSFLKKKKHSKEFPMNAIRAFIEYETDQIGVRYLGTSKDNVVLSIKRRHNDLFAYKHTAKLDYILELRNNLSFNIGYKYEREEASDWVEFENSYGVKSKDYTLGGFFATLRFAPGEKFVQGTTNRRPINMDAPIFTLTQEYGPKRFLGSDYVFNKTEFSASKRFWFSAFGYTNLLVKAGKIWSQVPYPALLWQNANLSYTIQQESFALLNPMEFAMDQYASWDMEYFINGAILNRIPLVKKAKLREIFTFKGFVGSLSKKNNPEYNPELFQFPKGTNISAMGSTPYMEIGVGLDNIFTILRLDYVWRLTYRNRPDIDKSGLRVSLHLSF